MKPIVFYDRCNISDRTNLTNNTVNYRKNFARVVLDGEVVDVVNNMVVLPGSAFIAQKLFGKVPSGEEDLRNFHITHFGIGSGGSTSSGGYTVLEGPDLCDTDLLSPIQIDPGNSSFLTSPRGVPYACKPIEQDGYFEFAAKPGINCDSTTYYTIMKCYCVINRSEPTFLAPGETVKVDEAALYYTYNQETRLFARITFSCKNIEASTNFIVEWFIIC